MRPPQCAQRRGRRAFRLYTLEGGVEELKQSRWVGACVVAAAAVLLACGGGDNGPPTSPGGSTDVVITLTAGARFSPNDVTIDPGTTVRWTSATSEFHTITPDDSQQPGVWSRATSNATGTVLTHTFNASGQTYTYHCEPHLALGMTGTIRVR
jgi:plastocyanin